MYCNLLYWRSRERHRPGSSSSLEDTATATAVTTSHPGNKKPVKTHPHPSVVSRWFAMAAVGAEDMPYSLYGELLRRAQSVYFRF
jgi:hypothetical protein